jgi:hypothetical protein
MIAGFGTGHMVSFQLLVLAVRLVIAKHTRTQLSRKVNSLGKHSRHWRRIRGASH